MAMLHLFLLVQLLLTTVMVMSLKDNEGGALGEVAVGDGGKGLLPPPGAPTE